MSHPSIHQLSTFEDEFSEPSTSPKPFMVSSYELDPDIVDMVQAWPFSCLGIEDPYHHLQEFEEVCLYLVIPSMSQETLRWKLFPFSLIEKAEQWYTHNVGNVNGDWEELRDDFCLSFYSLSDEASWRGDILSFEQLEESIGAAWARFSHLLASSPDWSILDDISLHIFYTGLDMDSADDIDIAAGG